MAYGASIARPPMPGMVPTPMNPLMPLEEVEQVRPKCGSEGKNRGDYDLTIHVVGLFLVLAVSCFGAGFPVVAKRVRWMKISPTVFFFCKHFGTGVLIATAFVHLLPTAFQSLNDPCLPELFTEKYPALPGVIGLASLFTLFSIELWMHSKMPNVHSHGSASGEEFSGRHNPFEAQRSQHSVQRPATPIGLALTRDEALPRQGAWVDEKLSLEDSLQRVWTDHSSSDLPSDMPPWFMAFYEQYVREREGMMTALNGLDPKSNRSQLDRDEAAQSMELGIASLDPSTVDPMVYRKMAMDITLLEGGILFHSIFVGMTVSITTNGFIVLLIAILFHQTFEGLGLGSRIAAVPYPKKSIKPWLLVLAFGTTAPIGQAIGLATRNTYDPNSAFALILVGTFNAISSGLLIYAALVDLLHHDFLSEESDRMLTHKKKMLAFAYVLLGAMGMCIVGAYA